MLTPDDVEYWQVIWGGPIGLISQAFYQGNLIEYYRIISKGEFVYFQGSMAWVQVNIWVWNAGMGQAPLAILNGPRL
jgi:hypothetical protein